MKLKRFTRNRKGTAEVIGTIMFVMILLFFFSDVYVWHDQNVKQMNNLYVEKMNAGMQMVSSGTGQSTVLTVMATGSDVSLSRLWIDSSDAHVYANLEQPVAIPVTPGSTNSVTIQFIDGTATSDGYGGLNATYTFDKSSNTVTVDYTLPANSTFTIVNTLGISTSS